MSDTFAFKTVEGRNAVYRAYDALMVYLKVPYEEIFVDTRFGKAFVIAAGEKNAPALVLLHGSGMNSVMWVGDIEKYSRQYRVYAVDLQGEPGKSDGRQLPFDGPDFALWLRDVFHGLAIQKASMVGISLGAWLSLKFGITHPDMIEKLVLLCPAGVGPQKASFAFLSLFHMMMGEKGMERLYRKIKSDQTQQYGCDAFPIPRVYRSSGERGGFPCFLAQVYMIRTGDCMIDKPENT